jgi:hypothetical protein
MVVRSEDGREIGRLEGTVTFSVASQTGQAGIRYTPAGASTTVTANAQVHASVRPEAFGAVTALVVSIAGRPTSGRSSLRLTDVKVEGDVAAIRDRVDEIAAWWDAQGEMTVDGYVSPVLSIAHLARLQLNVWGTETGPRTQMRGYAILLFDPADPTTIVGGRLVRKAEDGGVTVRDLPSPFDTHLSLTPITSTPTPNDYFLCIGDCESASTHAELVIDVLADGTIDVRGVADRWNLHPGIFTVEGTGNAKFVPPGS